MSERNDRPWFQVQAGILDSPDLNRLTAEQERVWWRLHALMARRGHGDVLRMSPADIAWACRMSESVVQEALTVFERPGSDGVPLVQAVPAGFRIVKWHDYQPESTGSERSRRARRATRLQRDCNVAATLPQRPCNGPEEKRGEAEAEEKQTQNARASDAEVRAHWSAYCEGTGRDLPYDIQSAERMHARSPDPQTTRAAADLYAASLSPRIKPSPANFAGKIGEWIAELQARDRPRLTKANQGTAGAVESMLGRLEDTG